jgi:hypothetical protein
MSNRSQSQVKRRMREAFSTVSTPLVSSRRQAQRDRLADIGDQARVLVRTLTIDQTLAQLPTTSRASLYRAIKLSKARDWALTGQAPDMADPVYGELTADPLLS